MEIDSETLSRLAEWAGQIALTEEDLKKKYVSHYENLSSMYPDKGENFFQNRARFMTLRDVKAARYIRAKPHVGVFLGYNQEFDLTAGGRAYAEEVYNSDREKAVRDGLTDDMGVPLDTQTVFPWGAPNPNYGKPLEPRWIRQSIAIGRPVEGGDLKLHVMTHNGDQALAAPPLGTAVQYLANMKSEDDVKRVFNSSSHTKYEPTVMDEFPDGITDSIIADLLGGAPDEIKTDLAGIMDWHNLNESDRMRTAIIEADVVYISETPMSTGNIFCIIEDESVMDIDSEGTTVFIHPQIIPMIDFGPGSRVFVIGRTQLGNYYDREKREVDTSRKVVTMNATGIWVIPEFKIPAEEGFLLSVTGGESVEE